jgi:hypothetical protein
MRCNVYWMIRKVLYAHHLTPHAHDCHKHRTWLPLPPSPQAEFKPLVQLDEVETSTGEEDEETLVDLKCKLYRFDSNNNEWKERGLGQVKLLKHKANQRVRLLMRQEKTLKIRANHIGERLDLGAEVLH